MPPFDFRPWLSAPGDAAAARKKTNEAALEPSSGSSPEPRSEAEPNLWPSRFPPADRWAVWLALLAFSGGLFSSLHSNGRADPPWRALLYPRPPRPGSPGTGNSSHHDDISKPEASGSGSSMRFRANLQTADARSGSQNTIELDRECLDISAPKISAAGATQDTVPLRAAPTLAGLANPPPYGDPPLARAVSAPRAAMQALRSTSKKKAAPRTAKRSRKAAVRTRSILAKWWASIAEKLFGRRPPNGAKVRASNVRKAKSSPEHRRMPTLSAAPNTADAAPPPKGR